MKKNLPLLLSVCICFLSVCFVSGVYGQAKPPKVFPSDAELIALSKKYLSSTITKTASANGDVFLQRNMSTYLHANITKAPETPAGQLDKGHDHKDAMLEEFLNRPQPSVATMQRYFKKAAKEFKVPVEILASVGQVQSNWAQVSESMYGSWGVMGLVENKFIQQISKAAKLLNVPAQQIESDAQTNIRAAAALLANYQKTKATTLQDWFASVKELTGLRDETMKTELAQRFYDIIKEGSKTVTLWGEIINIKSNNALEIPQAKTQGAGPQTQIVNGSDGVDYAGAIPNFTTCNYNSRPAGSAINFYFVHYVGTGTYQGAISWFKDCTSEVSAHYVVSNAGEISQVVSEVNRAWSQGVTLYNDQGIGVEHEVIATNLSMWDSQPMLAAASKLCANTCDRRGIPKTRRVTNGDKGIYGHNDVKTTDCPNLTQARWDKFMSLVQGAPSITTPTLYSIMNSGSGTEITATWKANTEATLAGYRLYYATDDSLSAWALAADETTLTASKTAITLTAAQFLVPPTGNVYHFKLTAVVTDGTNPNVESGASDIYSRSSNTAGRKVLIVDGFDRTSGSYNLPTHSFATNYFMAMRNNESLQISTVANEKVEDGTFVLTNYDLVVWFVGDESSANVVFSTLEKAKITSFLTNGGKLIVSGSEIAYNIGRSASATYDLSFMTNYLKATYVGDGAITYTPATGIAGTAFEGVNIPFGIVYVEDFPDDVAAAGGSVSIFNYSVAGKKGGVAYKGKFGAGTNTGGIVYLSFTLETALDSSMGNFMKKALLYLSPDPVAPTTVADAAITETGSAKRIAVLANDLDNGTAINTATVTVTTAPANGTATVETNGDITYTSKVGYVGTDNFQYKVSNTAALLSNASTVSITVQAVTACNSLAPENNDAYPKRDLRGAWVATVSNIDWPSSRTLTTAQQQAGLVKILDTLLSTGINTVYFQIRPESDALYASSVEPWSYWLTNSQGTAPSPLWDPLQFAIDQAHARGMELHAWMNPYRAKDGTPTLAPNHVAVLHPDWTFVSGTATFLNPGLADVRTYVTSIVADVANRYNVDGIHFDDYFYPYAGMTGQDAATYTNNNPTAIATIEDWRRNNVNQLIALVYDTLQKINAAKQKNVVFGVSPFGIWKVGTPAGITGLSSYNDIYCDPIAWLQAGKVDYVAPQLYWKITGAQDYLSLSKWWNDQAALYGRHVYPGLATYKITDGTTPWDPSEIQNQININRAGTHNQVLGQVMFSTTQLMADAKGIRTVLKANQYRYKSFAPAMAWKDAVCPSVPANVRIEADSLVWDTPANAPDGDAPVKYVVYHFANTSEAASHKNDGTKVFAITARNKMGIPAAEANSLFTVTALDKNNNESDAVMGSALPLTGLSLEVNLSGNIGMVNWSTLTEVNTGHFEIEKSADGINFTYLNTVAAAGNSSTLKKYNYLDNNLNEGVNFYRIKAVDKDGAFSYSAIKSLVYKKVNVIVAAPNPFTDIIYVSNLSKAESADIIDASGRLMYSKTLKNTSNLSIYTTAFPAGLYYLKVKQNDGSVTVIKLIKQH